MDREDCFANNGITCCCLEEKNCANCKFYKSKNVITREVIEYQIKNYYKNVK